MRVGVYVRECTWYRHCPPGPIKCPQSGDMTSPANMLVKEMTKKDVFVRKHRFWFSENRICRISKRLTRWWLSLCFFLTAISRKEPLPCADAEDRFWLHSSGHQYYVVPTGHILERQSEPLNTERGKKNNVYIDDHHLQIHCNVCAMIPAAGTTKNDFAISSLQG